MAVRVVDYGDIRLRITDQTHLADHAGAVTWNAGLVLSHYLHHSTRGIGASEWLISGSGSHAGTQDA